MARFDLTSAIGELQAEKSRHLSGIVSNISDAGLSVAGLGAWARLGDLIAIARPARPDLMGEIVALSRSEARVATFETADELAVGSRARLMASSVIRPHASWRGRIVDAFGRPLDGRPLVQGGQAVPLKRAPPDPAGRGRLGPRLHTGYAVLNTMLPLVRGQRLGIFAGSGIGKSTLLGGLARTVEADVIVLALIGERGRELREFVEQSLGPEGLARSVLVVATSDQTPLMKRRAAWAALSVAEYFRDQGRHALLLFDSLTRFAEAHREVALAAGERPGASAYPPSTAHLIASLTERSGPGADGSGDITAVYSVLVAGSDMEEPVADITRGVLDGHLVLDRAIAERGRFPAIDVRRSVSRSLPAAASAEENETIKDARRLLGDWSSAEALVQSGLYASGSDPATDRAIRLWPALDRFFAETSRGSASADFAVLDTLLDRRPAAAAGS